MEKLERDFLLLTQYVATGNKETNNDWENTDWSEIYKICNINKMVANTHDWVKELIGLSPELLAQWDRFRFMTFVRQKKCFYSLRDVVNSFDEKQISYVVFKGNIIANLYANPYYRISADSDVFVEEDDREAATRVLLDLGYKYVEEESKDIMVSVFIKEEAGHKIELHTSLFEDYSGAQIDILNNMNLTAEEKRTIVEIDGTQFTTLGHEEHLIFQIFHFVKHFILEGVSIRYLIDITLFINSYYNEINWNSFWKKMQTLKYDTFCDRFFYLCKKYYGLNPEVIRNRAVTIDEATEESLLLDLIYKGNSNNNQKASYHLTGNLVGYLEGDKEEINTSPIYKKLKTVFPNQNDVHEYYLYAKKHKALVPVAWLHRPFHSLRLRLNKTETYSVKERGEAIDEREKMIMGMGLVDKSR